MNIGEATAASGISAKMIRYYESIGLIRTPARTDAGYRRYTDADVHTLRFIKRARDLGFSIERIRALVDLWQNGERRSRDVNELARVYIDELNRDIAKLESIRAQLETLVQCCHGDNRPDCPILDDLAGTLPANPEDA